MSLLAMPPHLARCTSDGIMRFTGTDVPVHELLWLLADGGQFMRFLELHPEVTADQVRGVLDMLAYQARNG
jgi:uncharacterized protein (DUF433 family)